MFSKTLSVLTTTLFFMISKHFLKISLLRRITQKNFEDKVSFIINISQSEIKNNAFEDENNGTEENEISDDE